VEVVDLERWALAVVDEDHRALPIVPGEMGEGVEAIEAGVVAEPEAVEVHPRGEGDGRGVEALAVDLTQGVAVLVPVVEITDEGDFAGAEELTRGVAVGLEEEIVLAGALGSRGLRPIRIAGDAEEAEGGAEVDEGCAQGEVPWVVVGSSADRSVQRRRRGPEAALALL